MGRENEAGLPGASGNRALGIADYAAIYLGVAAATLPAVLPVMVGVFADVLAYGVARAGYVASANLGGVALGSAICAALAKRYDWRQLIGIGVLVMVAANLVTMLISAFLIMTSMRFVAGVGEGLIAAIAYAAMSRSAQPERSLAFYIAGQGLVGAVGMGLASQVMAAVGWQSIFVIVSLVMLPAFWMAKPVDALRPREHSTSARMGMSLRLGSVAELSVLFVYFVGMSAVWALIERIGHAKQLGLLHLAIVLSSSAVANMAGSLSVGLIAHRLGTLKGLAAGLLITLSGLTLIVAADLWTGYLLATILFVFGWGFHFPFLFRQFAQVDSSSRVALLIPLMTGGGFTLGPSIGATVLVAGGTSAVCAFAALCATASTLAMTALNYASTRVKTTA